MNQRRLWRDQLENGKFCGIAPVSPRRHVWPVSAPEGGLLLDWAGGGDSREGYTVHSPMSEIEPIDSTLQDCVRTCLDTPAKHVAFPHVLLTYAQSIDGKIAAKKGTRTRISGPETKAMTHFIRTRCDAILVGINTVLADNPSLNCRYPTSPESSGNIHLIRPIIIDPNFKFAGIYKTSKLIDNYVKGKGAKPIIVVSSNTDVPDQYIDHLDILYLDPRSTTVDKSNGKKQFQWPSLLQSLKKIYHVNNLMVEGGAHIINTLLTELDPESGKSLVDALIITIGSVYLGQEGVGVCPKDAVELTNKKVAACGEDTVIFANL